VYVRTGQYGPYVQLGEVSDENPKPKRMSLPRGVKPEDVTLDLALGLLALPRLLGIHPESGGKVSAGLGRFGPYVVLDKGKEGKDYRSIKGDDHVLTITLGRALEMLAQPKMARGRRAEPKPVREVGKHPEDQQPINLFDGRYGPYVKHGDVSASIPRGQDPATVTLDQAVELIAARAGFKKAGGGRKKSKAGKALKAPPARVAEAKPELNVSKVVKRGRRKAKKAARSPRAGKV
jgi:DNA topoisomerase-1